jgi:hypothetical protein
VEGGALDWVCRRPEASAVPLDDALIEAGADKDAPRVQSRAGRLYVTTAQPSGCLASEGYGLCGASLSARITLTRYVVAPAGSGTQMAA